MGKKKDKKHAKREREQACACEHAHEHACDCHDEDCDCGCDDEDCACHDEDCGCHDEGLTAEQQAVWDMLDAVPALDAFARMCDDGWHQGWHEACAGSLVYVMDDDEVRAATPLLSVQPSLPLGLGEAMPELGGATLIATGCGARMRNVATNVYANVRMVRISDDGAFYQTLWGADAGFSTFDISLHAEALAAFGIRNARVSYHAHTPALMALGYVLPADARTLTRVLWKSLASAPGVLRGGVGVVPTAEGLDGEAAARAMRAEMAETGCVVWGHEGTFATGQDFDDAFGRMHVAEKAARIYLDARAANGGRDIFAQTIADADLHALASRDGVRLRVGFLG